MSDPFHARDTEPLRFNPAHLHALSRPSFTPYAVAVPVHQPWYRRLLARFRG